MSTPKEQLQQDPTALRRNRLLSQEEQMELLFKRVAALEAAANIQQQGTAAWTAYEDIPSDGTTPGTPTNLTAIKANAPKSVLLIWDPNIERDLHHYNIYFDLAAPVARDITDFNIACQSNEITIPLATGQERFFAVTAVDQYGNESGLSNEVSSSPSPAIEETVLLNGPVRATGA